MMQGWVFSDLDAFLYLTKGKSCEVTCDANPAAPTTFY
jgi:hypothetical protein